MATREVSRLNHELVTSQIAAYDKTGRWPVRQVARLNPPLMVATTSGPATQVKSGLVNGLFHKMNGRYVDIRHGYTVARAYGKDGERLCEQFLSTQARDLVEFVWVVLWDEDGKPFIQILPDVTFKEG